MGLASRNSCAVVQAALCAGSSSVLSKICTPLFRDSKKSYAMCMSSLKASANGTNVSGKASNRAVRASFSPPASSSSKNVRIAIPKPMSGSVEKGSLE